MLRNCAVPVLAALLASLPALVRAAPPSTGPSELPIALEYSGCEALDRRELLKLLAIEFETLNVEPKGPLERVRISCGPNLARVTIGASNTVNEVELAATAASAWPRLLALSVSEIVIESRARLQPKAAAAAPQVGPKQSAKTEPRPERIAVRDLRVFAGASVRHALRPAAWLWGPELGLELAWARHFSFAAEVRAEFGRADTDVAKVSFTSASGALSLLIAERVGAWRLALGPGLCLGYLRLSPSVSVANATGHAVSGIWGGPELVGRAQYDFSSRWFAQASVDSGVVTWPVSGLLNNDRRLVDSGGVWIASGLALGALF